MLTLAMFGEINMRSIIVSLYCFCLLVLGCNCLASVGDVWELTSDFQNSSNPGGWIDPGSAGGGAAKWEYFGNPATYNKPILSNPAVECNNELPTSGIGWTYEPSGSHLSLCKFNAANGSNTNYQIGDIGGHSPLGVKWTTDHQGWFKIDASGYHARKTPDGRVDNLLIKAPDESILASAPIDDSYSGSANAHYLDAQYVHLNPDEFITVEFQGEDWVGLTVRVEEVDNNAEIGKVVIYSWDLRYASSLSPSEAYDIRHAAACIQGLVNRGAPRLFLNFQDGAPTMASDSLWLERLREPGGLCEGWGFYRITGIDECIQLFDDYIDGVVLYDSNPDTGVISTSLVATTVAGVENAIAVRKDMTAGSLYNYLVNDASGPQLPVLVDLTGKFTGTGTIWQTSTLSTGSAKCDAYIWAKEKYLDTGKCDPTILSYTLDLWGLKMNAGLKCQLSNLDYAVSRKGFCFELSPWGDEAPNDDLTQPLGADLNTFKAILNACNTQTGQSEMIRLCGFHNWVYKYCWYPGVEGRSMHYVHVSEAEWVLLITSYNAYYEAEAEGPQYISNASFYAGLKPEIKNRRYVQNPAPTYNEMVSRGLIDGSGNVVPGNYVLLGMGEYDNAAWSLYIGAGDRYDNWARGQAYCSWGINPINVERASVAVDYMYRHKTPKDYFVAWDSGAGAAVPTNMYGTRTHSNYPSIVNAWQKHCREYYRLLDYSISGWLLDGNDTAGHLTNTDVENYAPFSGDGVGVAINSPAMSNIGLVNNVPASKRTAPDNPVASDIINNASGVNFAWYRNILKYPSDIKSIEDNLAASGNNHHFLDAYSYYYLLRYYLGGNNNYRATWISDAIPRVMAAGENYSVTVTVRNDGWDTWSENDQYRLGYAMLSNGSATATSSDYDVNPHINLPTETTVNPGESIIFSFDITAPTTNGNYDLYYDMLREGVTWFHGQNNIEWKKEIIVATHEEDVDTDDDGYSDILEDQLGLLYWHPDDGNCHQRPVADLDHNCWVDMADLAIFASEWLK